MGEELAAAVDTEPARVKLPDVVGRAKLRDLLPKQWAEVYASEEAVVKGGIHAEISMLLNSRAFMSPSLRDPAVYHAFVLR